MLSEVPVVDDKFSFQRMGGNKTPNLAVTVTLLCFTDRYTHNTRVFRVMFLCKSDVNLRYKIMFWSNFTDDVQELTQSLLLENLSV